MSYESNPAGIGVGKRYGERGLGGVDGSVKAYGEEVELVFEFTSDTKDEVYSASILHDYLVTGLTLYVEEAWGAGATADISINGGAGLTTDLDLNTTGVSQPATTGATNLSGTGGVAVVLDLSDAQTAAATAGKAKLVVKYVRI